MPNRSRYLRNKLSYKKVAPLTSSMVYQTIKPTLIARFNKYLATRKKSKAGAPVKYDFSKFFDVVYEQIKWIAALNIVVSKDSFLVSLEVTSAILDY